jgi:hypothetical protein
MLFSQGRGVLDHLDRSPLSTWAGIGAVIVSTQKGPYAYDARPGSRGVFAEFLIKALEGEADKASTGNGDGMVSLRELVTHLQEGLFKWFLREQKKQMPRNRLGIRTKSSGQRDRNLEGDQAQTGWARNLPKAGGRRVRGS